MIGDVLLIDQKHERVARELAAKIKKLKFSRLAISVGGESGSGKSEVAETLRKVLKSEGHKIKILHLDNYYNTSPEIRNNYRREHGVSVVGLHEMKWDILEENIESFRLGKPTTIPFLDLFTNQEDKLITDFSEIDIIIIEGLYSNNTSADIKVYIDVTYHETKKAQLTRGKEKMDQLRLQVLEKEHTEVMSIRDQTDYFITPQFTLLPNSDKTNEKVKTENERLLIFSHKLPLSASKKNGEIRLNNRVDGVTSAIQSIYGAYESIWFGTCETDISLKTPTDKTKLKRTLLENYNCFQVTLPTFKLQKDFNSFCTNTLWPLFHYFTEHTIYNRTWWDAYLDYNQKYYASIKSSIKPKDTLWVHGYQLMLLPELIRNDFPDIRIGFFLHVPFPSFEIMRLIPWRKEILQGLLGADLIGFHTYEYTRHFLSSVYRLLGYETKLGRIHIGERIVSTDAFTLGIDMEYHKALQTDKKVTEYTQKLYETLPESKIILSINRLDYTRGITNKVLIIKSFFERFPKQRGKISFRINLLPPYCDDKNLLQLKKETEQEIKKCNNSYKTKDWQPIIYSYGFLSKKKLVALFNIADVFLIASLRDGLNLLPKEYLTTRTSKKGVLMISEFIGGAREMSEALLFNPNNYDDFINTIMRAISIPEKKQIVACNKMRERLERNTAMRWAVDFLEKIDNIKLRQEEYKSRIISPKIKTQLLTDFHTHDKRLLIFDYNGTLVPLTRTLISSPPTDETIEMLKLLTRDKKTTVAIVSDNEQQHLKNWFKDLRVDLIACSDLSYKKGKEGWSTMEKFSNEWKDEARPILERYQDRTPGSFISEKKYSMVFHFEKSSKELSEIRIRELMDDLTSFVASGGLHVHEGADLIEIKNAGIQKGHILQNYINQDSWDFILAAGDDWTNESMFAVLPETAYSIRVGITPTEARFNLKDRDSFIDVIHALTNSKR